MISHQVLHLGWSSLCFTALVGLIDSQMLQTVLCFVLLQAVQVLGKHANFKLAVADSGTVANIPHDFCTAPSFAMEETDETVKSNDVHYPG